MKRLHRIFAVAAFVGSIGSVPAAACTVCSSESGLQVRQGILGKDLKPALVATIAPFAVLAAAVIAISACPTLSEKKTEKQNA